MKASIANQKAIYGSRSPNFAHWQVSFAEGTDKAEKGKTEGTPLEQEVRNLTQVVTKLAGIMISSEQNPRGRSPDRTPSPTFNRYRSPTPPANRRPYSPRRQRSSSPGFNQSGQINRNNRRDSGYFRQRSPSSNYSSSETEKSLNRQGSSQLANPRS